MATLTVATTTSFSGITLNGIDLIDFTNTSGAATAIFANSQFNGTAILNNVVIDGTAQLNSIVVNGGSVNASGWQLTNWTDGTDTISLTGAAGADVITGSSRQDIISGGGGQDIINAGAGDDIIRYLSAGDAVSGESIDGGIGNDRIEFFNSNAYDLSSATISNVEELRFLNGSNTATIAGTQLGIGKINLVTANTAAVDNLIVKGLNVDLSGVTFTNWTSGTDTITINRSGDATARATLVGTRFNDTISATGGTGVSALIGGDGVDTLIGSAGNDLFIYNSSSEAAVGESITGDIGFDGISIQGNTAGSQFNFRLMEIVGVEKLEFLFGISAVTNFKGSQISASAINAVIGDSGNNTVQILDSAINLSGVSFVAWNNAADTIRLFGTSGADTITGSSQNDEIVSGSGADLINGGAGDDTFILESASGLAGATLNGDAGTADTISIRSAGPQYGLDTMNLSNIERLQFDQGNALGLAKVASTQIGTATGRINTVIGGTGDAKLTVQGQTINLTGVTFTSWSNSTDTISLSGTSGADAIVGSSQNDVIDSGAGLDVIDGGDGDDRFNLNILSDFTGVTINGNTGTADTLSINLSALEAQLQTMNLSNIERLEFGQGNFQGGARLAGTQIGTAAGRFNTIIGGAGKDDLKIDGSTINLAGVTFTNWTNGTDTITLTGTAGADTITGSSQSDTIVLTGGSDVVDGGDGNDRFTFNLASAATQTVNGGAGVDTLEMDQGPFSADLRTTNLSGVEVLEIKQVNSSSNTTLAGSQIGSAAGLINTVRGGVVDDILRIEGAAINLTGVTFVNFTNNNDAINLVGTNGADTIIGSDQNDNLTGGAGADILNGGAGNDTAFYTTINGAVTVTLTDVVNGHSGGFATGASGNDTLIDIENVAGSAQDDIITGNSSANRLSGGFGNDTIFFGNGDTINGGVGTDTGIFTDATAGLRTFNMAGSLIEDLRWATGGDQFRMLLNTDGTLSEIHANTSGTQNFTSQTTLLSSGGVVVRSVDTSFSDGTRTIVNFDFANNQNFVTFTQVIAAIGGEDFRDTQFDDGTRLIHDLDQGNNQSYTQEFRWYDALGRVDFYDTRFDDGVRLIVDEDNASNQQFTQEFRWYDVAGNVDFYDTRYDNGLRLIVDEDNLNNQAFTQDFRWYDAQGRVDFYDTRYDNGVRQIIDEDNGNLNPWNQRVDTYTPSGLLDTRDDRNDNGTRVFTDFDQGNAFAWSQHIQTFNAAGVLVSDIFV